ncbi:hypothetical protein, partial [Chromobacterium piscinae]|uniref:hypothetical protein n=1 Tax=Chromobacterium piscinae TaxID=686831 RepID=UPI0032091116
VALAAAASLGAEVASMRTQRPEGPRDYLLATPNPLPAGKRPLVILLHGHGGSARQLLGLGAGAAPLSQWMEIADREGLLLAG